MRIRSDSNSATIASTLNKSRPTGSVGSCTDPPRLSLTSRPASSSAIARASGSDRASRSSLATTSVSPPRHAANAWRRSRALAAGASQAVVDVDALGVDAQEGERVALRGEVLRVGRHARVADVELGHRHSMPVSPPSPARITEPDLRDTARVGGVRMPAAARGVPLGVRLAGRRLAPSHQDRPVLQPRGRRSAVRRQRVPSSICAGVEVEYCHERRASASVTAAPAVGRHPRRCRHDRISAAGPD